MKRAVLLSILIAIISVFSQEDPSITKEAKRALSYQSLIKDSLGNPIADGKYLITFRLYNSENSHDPVWFENQNVYIYDGILNVLLGNKQRLRPELFSEPLWVTLEIDKEESEKQYVSASSYSMYSGLVDLNAFAPSEDVSFAVAPDGRIVIDVIDSEPDIPSVYGDDWGFYTGGTNNWVLQTPDDGRQDLFMKNAKYSDWTRQTVFYENGDFEVNGNITGRKDINISGTLNVNSKINTPLFKFGNISDERFDLMSFTDRYGNAVGTMMYNRSAAWYGGNEETVGSFNDFVIYAREGRDLVLKSDKAGGDVYIGASTCPNNLRVTGKIYATEVEVKLDVFPDYVFKNDYNLLSLSETEKFINNNGHLPGMPSEKEVVENGMSISQMQLKLVEKIEELTLHMIRLEKENKELKDRLNAITE